MTKECPDCLSLWDECTCSTINIIYSLNEIKELELSYLEELNKANNKLKVYFILLASLIILNLILIVFIIGDRI